MLSSFVRYSTSDTNSDIYCEDKTDHRRRSLRNSPLYELPFLQARRWTSTAWSMDSTVRPCSPAVTVSEQIQHRFDGVEANSKMGMWLDILPRLTWAVRPSSILTVRMQINMQTRSGWSNMLHGSGQRVQSQTTVYRRTDNVHSPNPSRLLCNKVHITTGTSMTCTVAWYFAVDQRQNRVLPIANIVMQKLHTTSMITISWIFNLP